MKASDLMVTNVATVRPSDTVQNAAELLLKHRISGAPVVDEGGKLVGIISEADLIGGSKSDRSVIAGRGSSC